MSSASSKLDSAVELGVEDQSVYGLAGTNCNSFSLPNELLADRQVLEKMVCQNSQISWQAIQEQIFKNGV